MFKYKIIGDDKKEYGPVSVDAMRVWIQEGRANAQSRVQLDGETEWRPLTAFPELAAPLNKVATAPPAFSPMPMSSGPAQGNNAMAIAGFVCSLISIFCCALGLFSLVGLIFSIVGLVQIRRNPMQRGRDLAIAGFVLSALGLIFSAIFWGCIFAGIGQNLD